MANKKKVVVTGFEPFGEHDVNASWVAVQELEKLGLDETTDLYVREIPVEYQAVQGLLPALWKEHNPQLLSCFTVLHGEWPRLYKISPGHATICKTLNESNLGVTLSVSKDAGRYLCDYTYYTSLHLGRGCCAFIHVPPLDKPYSSRDLGRALQATILEMLQLLEMDHSLDQHCNNRHEH
ncbi:Pyroglutamyl-peptidase 1 [Takifugu flavidus]|uniref:Pyroglutamyl-peptidase 1 n=1 Tax=Takifugu flavidus TaxID=433684 RepID=A0A5C6NYW6_9TELE|nr:Pyroglutamyl-peptidase 1 [Takifugu flavidus]